MWWGNDITKCPGKNYNTLELVECPYKDKCYRYTVKPDNNYQSYSDFTALLEDGKKCEYFISNE